MEKWMLKEMKPQIDSGLLVYLKTFEPSFWNPAHAKNMVTKYASGEILCNLDSDHFSGDNYAGYVNSFFLTDPEMFLTGRFPGAKLDMMGRFCLWKNDFNNVGGYDESFTGYGFEDQDIYDRLVLTGRKEKGIDLNYLKTIPHNHSDRVKNTMFMEHIKFILISESLPEIRALIIKEDHSFEHGKLVTQNDAVSFDESSIETGSWSESGVTIQLTSNTGQHNVLIPQEATIRYHYNGIGYRKIKDNVDALYYYSLLFNQRAYKRNLESRQIVANEKGFGKGVVYKNFNYDKSFTNELK